MCAYMYVILLAPYHTHTLSTIRSGSRRLSFLPFLHALTDFSRCLFFSLAVFILMYATDT